MANKLVEYRANLAHKSKMVCSGCRCSHCSQCRSCDYDCKSNRAADGEWPATFNLQMSITSCCTRRCRHCYQADYGGDMSEDVCIKTIRDFRALCDSEKVDGEVTLTGGDPFCAPHLLWTAIAVAEKCQFQRVDVMTNGDLMTGFLADRLRTHQIVRNVQVSIDGLEGIHDEIRGTGSFARAVGAVRILGSAGYQPTVMMTVSKRNLSDVLPVHDLIDSLGGRTMGLDRFSPQGAGARDADQMISTEEWSDLCRSVLAWRDARGWNHTGLIRPLWHQFSDCTGGMCSVGLSGLAVLPNGDVLLCRRLPIVIGSVLQSSLLDIWESDSLTEWRDPNRIAECADCSHHGVCRGCRAMAYAVTGDAFAADPHCSEEDRTCHASH